MPGKVTKMWQIREIYLFVYLWECRDKYLQFCWTSDALEVRAGEEIQLWIFDSKRKS